MEIVIDLTLKASEDITQIWALLVLQMANTA
jgi:hypothetical protein